MTKYILIVMLLAGACNNGKIAVNEIKTTNDKTNKESIFNDFLVALKENSFSKLQPMMVKETEYVDYLQSLTTEKVDLTKLGGSVADIYKFHLNQTERSFNRIKQRVASSNIDWNNAVVKNVTWESEGDNKGQNARFTVESKDGNKATILAKGMSKVNNEWRLGNTFLFVE